jgi:hypothetical protein
LQVSSSLFVLSWFQHEPQRANGGLHRQYLTVVTIELPALVDEVVG